MQGKERKNDREVGISEELYSHKTLEERAAEFGGKLMLDGEYDWNEPVGREVWR